jgi:hypothetical protein
VIRKWSRETSDGLCRASIKEVSSVFDLNAGLTALNASADRVLVLTGIPPAKIRDLRTAATVDHPVIVLGGPVPSASSARPSASLLFPATIFFTDHIEAAFRKLALRRRAQSQCVIRVLKTAEELRAYFALRYNVWKSEG